MFTVLLITLEEGQGEGTILFSPWSFGSIVTKLKPDFTGLASQVSSNLKVLSRCIMGQQQHAVPRGQQGIIKYGSQITLLTN